MCEFDPVIMMLAGYFAHKLMHSVNASTYGHKCQSDPVINILADYFAH